MTKLITAAEIGEAWENINSDWPEGRLQELKRYVKDTLHDCAVLAGHYEDAARLRAAATTCYCGKRALADCVQATCLNGPSQPHAVAFHKMAAALCCPPAAEDDEPERLRKAGAL